MRLTKSEALTLMKLTYPTADQAIRAASRRLRPWYFMIQAKDKHNEEIFRCYGCGGDILSWRTHGDCAREFLARDLMEEGES